MFSDVGKLMLDGFEKIKPYLTALWITNTIILFLPENLLKYFSLLDFRNGIKPYMSVFFFLGLSQWLIGSIAARRQAKAAAAQAATEQQADDEIRAAILRGINHLPMEEIKILLFCLHKSIKTIYLGYHDAPVASLRGKGLLVAGASSGNALSYPHSIPDFVWDYLQGNKQNLLPPASDLENYRGFLRAMEEMEYKNNRFLR